MYIRGYNVNRKWKYLKEQIAERASSSHLKKLNEKDKICCFLKNTLLPRNISYKFPYLLHNKKNDLRFSGNLKKKLSLTRRNAFVLSILLCGFLMLLMACYYSIFKFNIYIENDKKGYIHSSLFNFSVFNYFNKLYFNDYFLNNEVLVDITISYSFDKFYFNTYIDYYNIYLYHNLKIFDVLLHFENFKYEEDVILYGKEKAEDKKLLVDYFIWDFLDLYDSLFFSYCIYEFYLYFNNYFFNFFNADFFQRTLVYIKKKHVTSIIKKNQSFLTTSYLDLNSDFLSLYKKKDKLQLFYNYKFLYEYKNKTNFKNKKSFNIINHIMNIKDFGIRMPYLFFLLYTWYSIYYRRMRYNIYISGHNFFQEYAGRMYFFILANNPFGKNKTKITLYKHQKLLTIYHFKSYVEMKTFNDWFYFYSVKSTRLFKFFNTNSNFSKFSFFFLLQNNDLLNMLKFDYNLDFFKEFYNSNLFLVMYNFDMVYSYLLFMKTPITKFNKNFRYGRLSFLNYKVMIETVYLLKFDKLYFEKNLKTYLIYNVMTDIYINSFNSYFLLDFYNYKSNNNLIVSYKILSFFDKIINMMFLLIDPFFFKYFWKRCFPRKWNKLWNIYDFIWYNLIMIWIDDPIINFNMKKYDFISYFLMWRIDTSSFSIINNFALDKINYIYIAINMLYRNRFLNLVQQVNFMLKYKSIKNIFNKQYYLINLKNFYFNILVDNLDFILLLFFNNIKKYMRIFLNNNYKFNKFMIYNNFIYRQYIYLILFETHYYNDWFYDWIKRILWTYKNFRNHEGRFFYRKSSDII